MRGKQMTWIVAALAALLAGQSARAWNDTGHKTIALIAWDELTPAVRAKMTALLLKHPQYATLIQTKNKTEELETQDFMTAATWPDLVRTDTPANRPFTHPSWHLIVYPFITGNVPEDKRPKPMNEEWKPGEVADNILQALKKCEADLKDAQASEEQKAVALAWILHLTGDVHQPMHTSSWYSEEFLGVDGDRRGNLTFISTGSSTNNLHAYWDNVLGSYVNLETTRKVAAQLKKDYPRKDFAEALKVTDFKGWALESFELVKTAVYMEGKLPHGLAQRETIAPLSKAYQDEAKAVGRKRIALAGYRLADQLNRLLGEGR